MRETTPGPMMEVGGDETEEEEDDDDDDDDVEVVEGREVAEEEEEEEEEDEVVVVDSEECSSVLLRFERILSLTSWSSVSNSKRHVGQLWLCSFSQGVRQPAWKRCAPGHGISRMREAIADSAFAAAVAAPALCSPLPSCDLPLLLSLNSCCSWRRASWQMTQTSSVGMECGSTCFSLVMASAEAVTGALAPCCVLNAASMKRKKSWKGTPACAAAAASEGSMLPALRVPSPWPP